MQQDEWSRQRVQRQVIAKRVHENKLVFPAEAEKRDEAY